VAKDHESRKPPIRRPWRAGPDRAAPASSWLALDDDELLARIETLPPDADADAQLIAVVRSDRHFFIRQEAAKRIRNGATLRSYQHDRHIGQILVRRLNRREDIAYLEELVEHSRHLEVRKAAAAQLARLRESLGVD
jgi:hypothetical protein